MQKINKTVLVILCLISFNFAQEYLWPTNSSTQLSATFGEYRSGHYHAGIDIKTNNNTGYPVYAIGNGYISRVRTSPFGYGKALYLQLNDGNTAVYGHLDGFAPKTNKYVKEEQKKIGRYSINKYFTSKQIPVKKGEIIAYTGCTGTRHPHLHFEIRDSKQQPLNPLQFKGLSIVDKTRPLIKKIAIVPLSKDSEINGTNEIKIFNTKYTSNGRYKLNSNPIQVSGDFGIELSTYDRVEGLWNKYGSYIMNLYCNNKLIFAQKYDRFSFNNTKLINLDRDKQLMNEGKGRFIRMWKYHKNAIMPFYLTKDNGILNYSHGLHDIKLEVIDFNGNKSFVSFKINAEQQIIPQIVSVKKDTSGFNISIKRDSTFLYKKIYGKWLNKSGSFIQTVQIDNFSKTDSTYNFTVPLIHQDEFILKLIGISYYSGEEFSTNYLPEIEGRDTDINVDIKYIQNPKTFLCKLKFDKIPSATPKFFLQSPDEFYEIKLKSKSLKEYVTEPVAYRIWDKAFASEIRIGNINQKIIRENIDFHCISRQKSGSIWSVDSTISITYEKNTVYDSLLVWKFHDYEEKDDVILSDAYSFFPSTQPFKDNLNIKFRYDNIDDIHQVGIYTYNAGKTKFVGAIRDTVQKIISVNVDGLGSRYVLARDTIPPVLSKIFPVNKKYYKASTLKYLKATIRDTLSGIAGERGIEMELDGEKVIFEYHPIFRQIKYDLDKPLNVGQHILKISIKDNALNETVKSIVFNVIQ